MVLNRSCWLEVRRPANLPLPLKQMVTSASQTAKRSLVRVCKALADAYNMRLEVTRDSTDEAVLKAVRRLNLKVHPDKGGLLAHSQKLNGAKDAWDTARREKNGQPGRPKGSSKNNHAPEQWSSALPTIEEPLPDLGRVGLRVSSLGVLLTYCGVSDLAQWNRFVSYVRAHQKKWKVKYWCAKLETSKEDKLQKPQAISRRASARYVGQ